MTLSLICELGGNHSGQGSGTWPDEIARIRTRTAQGGVTSVPRPRTALRSYSATLEREIPSAAAASSRVNPHDWRQRQQTCAGLEAMTEPGLMLKRHLPPCAALRKRVPDGARAPAGRAPFLNNFVCSQPRLSHLGDALWSTGRLVSSGIRGRRGTHRKAALGDPLQWSAKAWVECYRRSPLSTDSDCRAG